ncbi:MAG TPA: ATP-binding protein [Kofleriaceae bacterium]|nr:ATP-binding protein [Kofleriaceae bacterium]
MCLADAQTVAVLAASEAFAAASPSPAPSPAGVRLLVVDDDARVRRMVATAMSRAGFHVFLADDGAPALALADHTPPDLALVDFHMTTPGPDVVRQLRARYGAAIWIAVLTGRDDDAIRAASFAAGADDVLVKPVMLVDLQRRLTAAARTQQAFVASRLARERADRLLTYGAEAAAVLAHDLNNGLSVALCNMMYLQEAAGLAGDHAEALDASVTALRRMSGLVANFVDVARFEDAAVHPQRLTTHVRTVLREALAVHTGVPSNVGELRIACADDLLGHFDVALVERVLHNLLSNAIRHCAPGGTIELAARAWNPDDPTACEIAVFNTGPAVPEAQRDALFSKLVKGSRGKRGFGLYFCRLACEAHGGTIAYAPHGDGVRFSLRLPGKLA